MGRERIEMCTSCEMSGGGIRPIGGYSMRRFCRRWRKCYIILGISGVVWGDQIEHWVGVCVYMCKRWIFVDDIVLVCILRLRSHWDASIRTYTLLLSIDREYYFFYSIQTPYQNF